MVVHTCSYLVQINKAIFLNLKEQRLFQHSECVESEFIFIYIVESCEQFYFIFPGNIFQGIYSLIVEHNKLDLQIASFDEAVKFCFIIHWVSNIKYTQDVSNFWDFYEKWVVNYLWIIVDVMIQTQALKLIHKVHNNVFDP